MTRREGWRVRPNDVRQLPVGEAIVVSGGRAGRVRVERLLPSEDLLATAAGIASHPGASRAAPVFHPSPPPQVPGL